MKKLFTIMLVCLVVVLAACRSKEDSQAKAVPSNETENLTSSQETARDIVGKYFFLGPDDVEKVFHVTLSADERTVLANVPFSEERLTEIRSHTAVLLVAIPSLSVVEMREKLGCEQFWTGQKNEEVIGYNCKRFDDDSDLYENRGYENGTRIPSPPFKWASEKQIPHWTLISLTPTSCAMFDVATHKTWKESEDCLRDGEEFPTTPELVYALVTYKQVFGQWLLPGSYARTSTADANFPGMNDVRLMVKGPSVPGYPFMIWGIGDVGRTGLFPALR